MSPRDYSRESKRDDSVTFGELVGGVGLALVAIGLIGRWLLTLAGR